MKQMKTSLLALLSLVLTSSVALAQTTYISIGSGNWSNAASWLPSGVPGSAAGDSVVIAVGSTITLDITPSNPIRGILVNATGVLRNGTGTFTLTLSPNAANAATVFTNNGDVDFQFTGGVANVIFNRTDDGLQTINGSGTYRFNNLELTNTSPALTLATDFSPIVTTSAQTLGQTGGNSITINNLTVNNQAARARQVGTNLGQDNPTTAFVNLTAANTTLSRGVFILNPTASATRTHNLGAVTIGSAGSNREVVVGLGASTNTVMTLSNAAACTTNVTMASLSGFSASPNRCDFAMTSQFCDSTTRTTLAVTGNFNVPVNSAFALTCNARFGGDGGATFLNFGGDFIVLSDTANAAFNFPGKSFPTITLSGTSATYTVPTPFYLDNIVPQSKTNINANWIIPAGASVTMTPGSALAISTAGYSLTVNGTLVAQSGAQLISSATGGGSGNPIFNLGATGVLRVADPEGLGDGTLIGSPNDSAAPATPPLFFRQKASANPVSLTPPVPGNWNLSSINTNGTVEYNATATQVVTARTYNNLVINNIGGSFSAPSTLNNPNFANGNLTVDSLRIQRGILFLTDGASVTRIDTANVVQMGSATSTANLFGFNTGLIVNNNTDAISSLLVTGNFRFEQGGSSVVLSFPGTTGSTSASSALTVGGNFETVGSATVQLSGNGSTSGTVTNTFNFDGNVTILAGLSRFNGNRTANNSAIPTVNLRGTAATFNVPSAFYLGSLGETSALSNWVIASGANITMPSGSSIAIMEAGGYSLTVNGTLNTENGAELIATRTGAGSGNALLTMGASGIIRVADVDGLGDGTSIDPVSNFPLFIGRTAPGSVAPSGWNLSSINTSGTVDYSSATAQVITPRSGASNYNQLRISGGGAKSLFAATSTNILELSNGIVNTGANTLTVLSPLFTAVTGGSNSTHVVGNLALTYNTSPGGRNFPLGDGSIYRPLSVNASATAGTTTLLGFITNANANGIGSVDSPLLKVSELRYYSLSNTGSNGLTVTNLNGLINSDDGAGLLSSNTTIKFATRTTGNWISRGPASAVNTSLLPSAFSADPFSEAVGVGANYFVALGSTNIGDNPLPVTLNSFKANSTAKGVELLWETGAETESSGFTMMRRKSGSSAWSEIASYQNDKNLRAKNALNGASYTFLDNEALEVGASYDYQLRETSIDGVVAAFQPISLTVRFVPTANGFELAPNYPNPFNPTTTIRYQIPEASNVTLKVYDILGKEVATLVNERKEAGNYRVPFNAAQLSSGVYFYRIQTAGFVETRKMLLVK